MYFSGYQWACWRNPSSSYKVEDRFHNASVYSTCSQLSQIIYQRLGTIYNWDTALLVAKILNEQFACLYIFIYINTTVGFFPAPRWKARHSFSSTMVVPSQIDSSWQWQSVMTVPTEIGIRIKWAADIQHWYITRTPSDVFLLCSFHSASFGEQIRQKTLRNTMSDYEYVLKLTLWKQNFEYQNFNP